MLMHHNIKRGRRGFLKSSTLRWTDKGSTSLVIVVLAIISRNPPFIAMVRSQAYESGVLSLPHYMAYMVSKSEPS